MRCRIVEPRPKYEPLDELLEMPRIRLLRAITRFGWVSSEELIDVVVGHGDDIRANTYVVQLGRLVKHGFVDRRGERNAPNIGGSSYEYRINARGLAHIAEMLGRAAPERELGPLRRRSRATAAPMRGAA